MLTKNDSLCFVFGPHPLMRALTGNELADEKGAFRQPFVTVHEISFYAFIIVIVFYPSL